MALWEYLGAWSWTTKGLYHLNWDSTDSSGNWYNWTDTDITYVLGKLWSWAASWNWTSARILISSNLWIDWWNSTFNIRIKLNSEISTWEWLFLHQSNNTSKVDFMIKYQYNSWTRRIQFVRNRWGIATNTYDYNITLWTSNWYNIIWTYDWSNIKLYVDWAFIWQTACSWNWAVTANNSVALLSYNSTTWWANAIIDEVIIENRAWTAEEVRRYYTYSRGMFI